MAFQRLALLDGMSNPTGRNPDCEISRPRMTIHALPDEILLMTFDFCKVAIVNELYWCPSAWPWTWRNLAHVCQRWRYVVFSSPLGLGLRLSCTDRTSVREMLDIWPPSFPIEIIAFDPGNNIITALEHRARVCNLGLFPSSYSNFKKWVRLMRNPFPALTRLRLDCTGTRGRVPVIPDTFLGGSAPHLRSLTLEGVAFPTLPQFLLSSNDLSELSLYNIPDFGYISPEVMAKCLSGLTWLTSLVIRFGRGTIRGRARLPSLTHTLLPALTMFNFCGFDEYLEDLLARIDTPQIKRLHIYLFQQPVIDIRQLISRSRLLGPLDCAKVKFNFSTVLIQLDQSEGTAPVLRIALDAPGQQLPSLVQTCTQSSSLLSSITELVIIDPCSESIDGEDLMNHPRWLVLFDLFTAARTLRLSGGRLRSIISFLGGLSRERAIEVLPKLENLNIWRMGQSYELEEPVEEFIAARLHSDHPVRVTRDLVRDVT